MAGSADFVAGSEDSMDDIEDFVAGSVDFVVGSVSVDFVVGSEDACKDVVDDIEGFGDVTGEEVLRVVLSCSSFPRRKSGSVEAPFIDTVVVSRGATLVRVVATIGCFTPNCRWSFCTGCS